MCSTVRDIIHTWTALPEIRNWSIRVPELRLVHQRSESRTVSLSLPTSLSEAMVDTAIQTTSILVDWEACNKTDALFVLVCSVFCWPVIPAVGLGYRGYSTRRSGLASFCSALLSIIVCSVQWWLWGYSWNLWRRKRIHRRSQAFCTPRCLCQTDWHDSRDIVQRVSIDF